MSISSLVDRILESDDYLSVLREVKQFNTKSFEEFAKQIQAFDSRVKKKDIETELKIDPENKTVLWTVKQGHGNDKDRVLSVLSYDNGAITCDKSKKFYVPGTTNINTLVDANDLLKRIDGYLYELEREDNLAKNKESEKDDKEEKEEFKLDDSLVAIMNKLKTDGEQMLDKYKSIPPLEFNGKKYQIEKGTLMASTEREAIGSLEFPRDLEMDIYSNSLKGKSIRTALLAYYSKNGVKGHLPQFRMDMEKTPYFYFSVGPIPVKQAKGPEAKALLNYFDGKAVRFQPKE